MEYTKAQIDNELDGTPAGFVREADIIVVKGGDKGRFRERKVTFYLTFEIGVCKFESVKV